MPESTLNLLLSGAMGLIGGLITTPINGIVSLLLKQDELERKGQLERRARREELLLQHELEMKRMSAQHAQASENRAAASELEKLRETVQALTNELDVLKKALERLEPKNHG